MELYPTDIGAERYLLLLRRRVQIAVRRSLPPPAMIEGAPAPSGAGKRRPGRLGRFWTHGLGLDADTEARAATLLADQEGGASVRDLAGLFVFVTTLTLFFPALAAALEGSPAVAALLNMVWAAVTGLLLLGYPRQVLRTAHDKPLTVGEVELLLGTARNRVERAYLSLVLDVLRQSVPSHEARGDLRLALRALGDAVSGLPPEAFASEREAGALAEEAARLREAARREDDPVVAGSLGRQADALDRRAGLRAPGSAAAFAVRRATILRREVRQHIETLRAALPAFETSDRSAGASIAALGDAVRRVAVDAASVAQARGELEEEALRSALPAAAAAPAPQEQPATLRQWWRG